MKTEQSLRVLIVDDESLAREHIKELLATIPSIVIAGEADHGYAAVKAIQELKPDIVFLDIQMPGINGIEVVRKVGPDKMPITIFITAHDHYALGAFELAAIDYLLKPFDDERFENAVRRARHFYEMRESSETALHFRKALEHLTRHAEPASQPVNKPLTRIAIESRGQVRMVLAQEIDYITASGVYAEIHVGDKAYVIRERMQNLESKLDPKLFFRVHRSIIVQLDRIDVLLRQAGGDYNVRLKGGTILPVSRSRIDELEHWMGVPESSREDIERTSRSSK